MLTRKNIFDTLIVIFITIFPFRKFLGPYAIGEPFDTKAQLIFHDHWYKFLVGKQDFFDLGIFYPYTRSFALSDLFVISGPIHAFFRLINIDLVSSLELATLSVVLLGNIGWLYLAKAYLSIKLLQYSFLFTISSSSTYIGHVYLKPNAASYCLISWLIFFLLKFSNFRNQSKNVNSTYLGLIIVLPAVFALNVWYVAYFVYIFSILSIVIFGLIVFLTNNLNKLNYLIRDLINNLDFKIIITFLILTGSLYALFFATYYPELKNGYGETNKQLLLENSPTLVSLFDSSAFGGGYFSNLYLNHASVNDSSIELQLGITAFIFLLFVISLITSFITLINSNKSLANTYHFSILITSLILLFSIIKILPDLSIFSFFWDQIFLLRTMRVPVRLLIIFNFIALIYIFKYADLLLESPGKLTSYFLFLFISILMLDQQRIPTPFWSQNELIDQQTLSFSEKINDCPAFILNREEVGWWKDTIDAMVLSNLSGIPTVNGFSSSTPKFFPNISWSGNESLEPIINWLEANDRTKGVCLITQNSTITRLPVDGVSLFFNQGFLPSDSNEFGKRIEIGSNNAKISLQNLSASPSTVNLTFDLSNLPCIQSQKVRLLINDDLDLNIDLDKSGEEVKITTRISKWEHKILNFLISEKYCINDNNEKVFMNLENLRLVPES